MNPIALDVHAHLVPFAAERLAGLPGVVWHSEPPKLTVDGHAIGIANLYFPERLLAWMEEHSVDRALVSVPPPLYRQQLDERAAELWARALNDGLLELTAAHDQRLSALLHLPMEHPALALRLLRHYEGHQFEGVALAAGGDPRILFSDAAYEPLWKILDDKGAFVFLHPGACADGRLASFYLENLIGNPMETGVAAAHLVMAGVPARYPRGRFCLAHAGGVFTSLVGRMERGFETRRPGVDHEVERPLQAARRFYADCIAHHPGVLSLARDVFGPTHILFGSDWPFPMGLPDGMPAEQETTNQFIASKGRT
ncbi:MULTISPECIES: amidohydrolase family protein [unclassified Variovorax]|uniref:amidohydrolase family protein n=1 Tax=unclassified Variovorax TaxID=663243 RepID=UPI003F480C2C